MQSTLEGVRVCFVCEVQWRGEGVELLTIPQT